MLLDKYTLAKDFEKLLTFHNSSTSSAPASYIKRVNQSMTRVDPLLKTLQVRPSPPEGLVQAYLIHIGDRSDVNFKKILELKGVRKQEHAHLLELFAIHRDGTGAGKQLVDSSSLLTPLVLTTASALGSTGLPGMNLPGGPGSAGLQGRFDAASLGERLLSAARDASDRLGTPTPQGPAGALGDKATINDNLKNIGKFFRRDIGVRFGKRDITPTGGGLGGDDHHG
ncbi:hypothetical protein BD289DRAFT_487407 [Coniella lustricola]|uniref:Vps53 C-terminal domain-containing protein n=1 Tax=Coniella lustricola TaxID=2025994 RepID=A0A2T2ZS15_9PEZI|nr:hypothetical protein BD289DRAFT_487407 [Coniella lustricola]